MKICVGAWMCFLSFASLAAEYVTTTGDLTFSAAEPRECFDLDNRRIPECIEHFYEQSQAELEAILNRIRQNLHRDTALFEDAHAKWLAFKESECKVRAISASAYQDPVSTQHLFVRACTAELNAARALQLNSIPLGCDACLQ